VVPEQHGQNTGHAEHQREGEEIPFLAQKIYVRILKKFHSESPLIAPASGRQFILNTKRFAALFPAQPPIKNDAGHKNRGK
jgi:hypothetical protein